MFRDNHKIFILFISLFVLLFISSSLAEISEYIDYIVKKGDTLWDISKEELKDPFVWPKIWKENPEIKNPDLIYPDQKIRIPLYLLKKEEKKEEYIPEKVEVKPERRLEIPVPQKEEKPTQQVIKPAKKEPLINKNILAASGYIADKIHAVGQITDSLDERRLLTKGDFAYIRVIHNVQKGDKFYVINPVTEIKHPVYGYKMGHLIEVLGIIEVVSIDNNDIKVKVTDAFLEIPVGSLLDNFYEISPPPSIEKPRRPSLNGYVVATKQLQILNGILDIVYIDKGKANGLEVGDLLATTIKSQHKIINGIIQIISLQNTTATAIIKKINREILTGDPVTNAT
jgi:LysM repeat protein